MSNDAWINDSPLKRRSQLRICHVRAVGKAKASPTGTPITQAFDFGRLERQIATAGVLAPRLLAASGPLELTLTGEKSGSHAVNWQRFLICTHANELVDIRILATDWHSIANAIGLLEDLYYEQLLEEPHDWDYSEFEGEFDFTPNPTLPFHQLIFVPNAEPEPDWETTQRLIYRADLDAIEEQSSIGHPAEINRRPGQLAAVGSFASVLWGLQDYVEKATILSAALTVAALERIRTTRLEAIDRYQQVANSHEQGAASTGEIDAIRRLEADLTFGAEATAQIHPLIQSLRVDGYHRTLQEAADVLPQAELVARMLHRLKALADDKT